MKKPAGNQCFRGDLWPVKSQEEISSKPFIQNIAKRKQMIIRDMNSGLRYAWLGTKALDTSAHQFLAINPGM